MKKKYLLLAARSLAFMILSMVAMSFITEKGGIPERFILPSGDAAPCTQFETGKLDEAIQYLDEKIKEFDEAVFKDAKGFGNADLEVALTAIDFSELEEQLTRSLAKIDFSKIEKDIENAIGSIDKMDFDPERSKKMMRDITLDKATLKRKIDEAVKEINFDRIKLQLDSLKKDFRKKTPQPEELQTSARLYRNLITARQELLALKTIAIEMEKEGLIENSENNRIQFIGSNLYINGQVQDAATQRKYARLLLRCTAAPPVNV